MLWTVPYPRFLRDQDLPNAPSQQNLPDRGDKTSRSAAIRAESNLLLVQQEHQRSWQGALLFLKIGPGAVAFVTFSAVLLIRTGHEAPVQQISAGPGKTSSRMDAREYELHGYVYSPSSRSMSTPGRTVCRVGAAPGVMNKVLFTGLKLVPSAEPPLSSKRPSLSKVKPAP